jgi:hypothetical protein
VPNTVVVIYASPGGPVDAGGFVIIVGTDKNGNQILKKVPVPGGPGDPGGAQRIIQAAGSMLAALDGAAGAEAVRAETAELIKGQVQALVNG